jgi:putative (di)nucleoside polyphosphate hydrolase
MSAWSRNSPRWRATSLLADKPYRSNVGIALFNADGRVLVGRRFRDDGPEIILPGLEWQMPQGGVDGAEDLRAAAERELWEETGVTNADYLAETDWLTYEFPPYHGPQSHRLAKFRGQRQKWFALRFTGREDEIDPLTPRNNQPVEFDAWRWERLDRVADLVVPFRREVYRAVAARFAEFAGS